MLSQCANPQCDAQFLHFGEGKLIAVHRRGASADESKVEFFWLCGECVRFLDLEVPLQGGPHVVARDPTQPLTAH